MKRLALCSLPALLLAFACSSGDDQPEPDFSGTPLVSITSDGGRLLIEARTSPQPPAKGPVDVELRVTDAEGGAAVDDLTIVVSPWMSHHGHGANQVEAAPKGGGRYVAGGVLFSMSGEWELKLDIGGAFTDTASSPSFDVLP